MNRLSVAVVALLAMLSAEVAESRKLSQAAGYDTSAARSYAQDVVLSNIPAAAHGLESATGNQLAQDIFAAVNYTAYTGYETNETVANATAQSHAIAQSLSKANVSLEDQVTAFGSALVQFLNESSVTAEPFENAQKRHHAFQVLDAAFSAGLSQSFDDIFAQAKSQLARSMKTVAAVVGMFDAGVTPTAVQGRKAATNTFGATASSLSGTAGNATDAGQLLLFSALLGVQAGGYSGPDNQAHSSNDLQQAQALAVTINQSTLAPADVSLSLSQAIAAAMNSGIEAAALLIETANIVNSSAAVPVVAQAFRQAHDNGVPFAKRLAPFCQVEFAAMDISPATDNTTTAALLAAFGQEQVSDLRKTSSCRRWPGVVG